MNDDLNKKRSVVEILKNKKLNDEHSKKEIRFNIEDVYLGEIREFSSEENGGISLDIYSYLFLVRGKDGLLNPLCLSDTEKFAVYRTGIGSYNNYIYVQGEEKDGPCIVVSPFTNEFRERFDGEVITLADLENYILRVKGFFKDREEVVKENFLNPITKNKLLKDDSIKKDLYDTFMKISPKQLRK